MTEAPRLSAAPETGKWRIPHECAMGAVHHNRSQDLVRRGDRGVAHRNRSQDLVWRSVTRSESPTKAASDESAQPAQKPRLLRNHGSALQGGAHEALGGALPMTRDARSLRPARTRRFLVRTGVSYTHLRAHE